MFSINTFRKPFFKEIKLIKTFIGVILTITIAFVVTITSHEIGNDLDSTLVFITTLIALPLIMVFIAVIIEFKK